MKILIVHNNYGKYSGEESVVDRMAEMFRNHGHEVVFYRKTTEGARESLAGKIKGFIAGIYCPSGVKGMRKALKEHKPDVVNVHNLYPFISPAALAECKRAGIPVVMTVHNFRLMCPTGLFMRNGMPCELCLERGNEWGCVKHNCEHSILKSVGYAARNAVARLTRAYVDNVDRFACITEFQRQKLIQAGIPAEKIVVIPNSIDATENYNPRVGEYIAYIGRLSYEKGYDMLIDVARHNPNIKFRFAGAQRTATDIDIPHNVEFMGYLTGNELNDFIENARFIVMPSRCYEGFPMAILEAAQHGKPTIGPNHGGFTSIIGEGEEAIGKLFVPGNEKDLERQIVELWKHPEYVETLGAKAFHKLQQQYSSEVVYDKWIDMLEKLIRNR